MKHLKITTHRYKDKKLIVDDDIYEKFKDESILCYKQGEIHSIRIYRGNGISSENLDKHIVPHNPVTHKLKYLNGNDFDKRRCNIAVIRRNTYKTREHKYYYTNKYKGVYFLKHKNYYISNIVVNDRTCYLGSFYKEEDAALTYDAACRYCFKKDSFYINIKNKQIELSKELKLKLDKYMTEKAC